MQPLTAPPRDLLTAAQVQASLAFKHSTKIRWGVDVLNSQLQPTGIVVDVTDAAVSWQWRAQPVDGQAPVSAQVRRTASLRYRHEVGFNPLGVLYRPWVEMLGSDAVWVRWHLGVFTAVMPPFEYDGHSDQSGPLVWRPLELADRSHFWQSDETPDPVTVAVGTDVVQYVKDDLGVRFNELDTTGIIADSPAKTATQDYVFDAGTPWLAIYNTLLGAVGNEPLHTTADGLARSRLLVDPEQRPSEHSYSFATTVVPQARVEAVNPELPNTVRFVARRSDSLAEEGDMIRTVVNESTGPASRQQRGGRTVLVRVNVDAQTQEELDAQARALAPFYFAGGGLRYVGQVGLNPRHDDSDVVFLERPALGISGNWLVTSWSIRLGTADEMRVMDLQLEQLTGAAFVSLLPVPVGAFGTYSFGSHPFGGPV